MIKLKVNLFERVQGVSATLATMSAYFVLVPLSNQL